MTEAADFTVEKAVMPEARILKNKRMFPLRPRVPARGFGVKLAFKASDLGTRVFRPSLRGTSLKLAPPSGAEFKGFLPDHLAMTPIPAPLEKELYVKRYLDPLAPKLEAGVHQGTTVFPPDERYTFSDTSYPWSTIGRVDTAGGIASGVLVGPRHLLTCSHVIVWNADNTCGWVQFRPSFFDNNAPFGEAWATHWYAYKKVYGPDIDVDEGRQDYVVLVLDRRIGEWCGHMGSIPYSDDWDGKPYWSHVGFPGDLAACQRPSYQGSISLDGAFWEGASHQRIWHRGDVWKGQSGGPFFAWWAGESFPRVVSVQSGQNADENSSSGGGRMVDLIIRALNDFP